MSWAGIKKAMSRAGTSVMMKTGQVDKTIDRQFDTEERRFRQLEKAVTELNKEAKGYLDSLRAMTSAQVRIAETVDVFYGDAGSRDNITKEYLTAVQELDTETIKELDEPFRTTVLDPINRFHSYFSDINEAIKKRAHKQMDYDRLRAKTKRLVDKPSDDAGKLPLAEREEKLARETYEDINTKLSEDLPRLLDARLPYLDPSFEALVKIQLRFCTEAYTRLAEVQQHLDASLREDYANGQLDANVEQALVHMQGLTIASLQTGK